MEVTKTENTSKTFLTSYAKDSENKKITLDNSKTEATNEKTKENKNLSDEEKKAKLESILKNLLGNKGDNVESVNQQDPDGNTPMHQACKLGKTYIAMQLFALGADITIKNKEGFTPMTLAAKHNNFDVIVEIRKLELEQQKALLKMQQAKQQESSPPPFGMYT